MPNTEDEELLRPGTPDLDPAVASLAARLTDSKNDSDDGDDDILAELEKDDDGFDFGALREKRMEELKREMTRVKDMREQDHGRLSEITDEKDVIKASANEKRCVIHFYHRDFRRCQIMNEHLEIIAPKYFSTRFLRVFVENVPWLVEKLAIKILPCVICFIEGASKDRLTGFEELGSSDTFETAALELRLQMSGVLEKPKLGSLTTMYGPSSASARRGIRDRNDESDSDD